MRACARTVSVSVSVSVAAFMYMLATLELARLSRCRRGSTFIDGASAARAYDAAILSQEPGTFGSA
eukprot:COSAG05_NODE_1902_length_3855_cov_11.469649_2_plen_66_part_00